jgi:NodT family efflux transporter outer membrane factor (OMF) lipoprotein
MLLSEVATTYVQIRTFQQRLAYARQNVVIQAGSLGIADDRFKKGTSSELDVTQAAANLAQTEALIPQLRAGLRQANNALSVLLGLPPSDLVSQFDAAPIPRAPLTVAIGIPADLLRRRPDVRQAERQVAAQSAQIGVAEADFYPSFKVNGFIGYAASDFRQVFDASSLTTFVFPSAQWNILNYGRILNNVRTQEAHLQTVALQYQATVLRAGREVEDGLVQFVEAQKQAEFLAQSVKQASRSVELVNLQYRGGISDFNRVYTTQAQLVTQQDQLAATQGNIALQLIAVYRALGGGWEYFRAGNGMPQMPEPLPETQPLPPTHPLPPQAGEDLPLPEPAPAGNP